MLIPPKPIRVLEIIVLNFKGRLVLDKLRIPRVISIEPFKIELTTSCFLGMLHTQHIILEIVEVICKLFSKSIIIKLKTI